MSRPTLALASCAAAALAATRSSEPDAVSLLQLRAERLGEAVERSCFHAASWLEAFASAKHAQVFSQGDQDAVLDSLFQTEHLGATNRYYAEFGFNQDGYEASGSGPNTQLMSTQGWKGLLMDGGHESAKDNLHKEFITRENIAGLFDKYEVPSEPDYVSIDIDSCDLQVYLGLMESKRYRPRVLTVEYNALWSLEESKANRCVAADGERYTFKGDGLHGVSLAAIAKAAHENGYKLVYVTKRLDAFLVREDLVCADSEPPLETWRPITGLRAFPTQIDHPATEADVARWVQEY